MNLYVGIAIAVAAVWGYIKYLKSKNNSLEASQLTSEAKKTDAVLKQKQDDLAAQSAEIDKKIEEVKKDDSPADADYWNKKLKK